MSGCSYSRSLTHVEIHLHHERAGQDLPARLRCLSGHLALVSLWREDRRHRRERVRQVDAASRSWPGSTRTLPARRRCRPGYSVGFLPQEPQLDSVEDRARQRRRGRRAGAGAAHALRRNQREVRRGAVAGGDGQGPRGAGEGPGRDRGGRARGTSTRSSNTRWTRCGCRRPTRTSRSSRAASAGASRCAGCCCNRPICCSSTSRPTTSTPSRSPGSSTSCTSTKGSVVAITHDRYFLDNVAGWILELDRTQGVSLGRQLLVLARPEAAAAGGRGEAGDQAAADAAARARVDPHVAASAAGERQGAPQRVRTTAGRRHGGEDRSRRDLHSARAAARRRRGRGARSAQGLRRSAAHRRPRLHAAARRHRRRDRAQRRRQDDALPDAGGAGDAGRRHAASWRDGVDRLRRSVARLARGQTRRCGKRSPAARTS